MKMNLTIALVNLSEKMAEMGQARNTAGTGLPRPKNSLPGFHFLVISLSRNFRMLWPN
jgi:hypothetical protein